MFWILGSVLDSGKCFGFWVVFLDSGKWFWILGSVLDSGKCFGFWEVFLDSGKCFWILGSVFGFWEVFLDSGKCFWILGSVLDSGKCFVPMGHHKPLIQLKYSLKTFFSPPETSHLQNRLATSIS